MPIVYTTMKVVSSVFGTDTCTFLSNIHKVLSTVYFLFRFFQGPTVVIAAVTSDITILSYIMLELDK